MTKTSKVEIRLSVSKRAEWDEAAQRLGVSLSTLVRTAVEEYVAGEVPAIEREAAVEAVPVRVVVAATARESRSFKPDFKGGRK